MKKIKSKNVQNYVMNDMVWKVDLPSFLKEIAECSKSIPYAKTFKIWTFSFERQVIIFQCAHE